MFNMNKKKQRIVAGIIIGIVIFAMVLTGVLSVLL